MNGNIQSSTTNKRPLKERHGAGAVVFAVDRRVLLFRAGHLCVLYFLAEGLAMIWCKKMSEQHLSYLGTLSKNKLNPTLRRINRHRCHMINCSKSVNMFSYRRQTVGNGRF